MTDLLKMIEELDHTDQAACDEVNKLFWLWCEQIKDPPENVDVYKQGLWVTFVDAQSQLFIKQIRDFAYNVATSLDALKAVADKELSDPHNMYEGSNGQHQWTICFGIQNENGYVDEFEFGSHFLPTMQLAWLHALIQAIQWKRENDEK